MRERGRNGDGMWTERRRNADGVRTECGLNWRQIGGSIGGRIVSESLSFPAEMNSSSDRYIQKI